MLLASCLAFVGTAAATPVRERTPIQVSGESMASIAFAQLVVKAERGFASLTEAHVTLLNDLLRRTGYNVPGVVKSVFKETSPPETDFVLAGTIVSFDCIDEYDTTCGMSVDWELLDDRIDAVTYRVRVRYEETQVDDMSWEEGINAMLLGVTRSLLARKEFVNAVVRGSTPEAAAAVKYPLRIIERCSEEPPPMPERSGDALSATVVIRAKDRVGSGVIISPDGFILTAAHVATRDHLEVRLLNGEVYPAEVLRRDRKADVALLRMKDHAGGMHCLQMNLDSAQPGQDIYVLGSPGGEDFSFSVSRGIVSGTRPFRGNDYLQTDAAINPGNSGGPLVGRDGRVRAIASWKVFGEGVEGLGFGVPSSTALSALALTFGDATETIAADVRHPSLDTAFFDEPDPEFFYLGEDPPGRTPAWVGAFRGVGYPLVAGGIAAIAFPWLADDIDPDASAWSRRAAINAVGWAAAGIGLSLVLSSYIFKPQPRPPGKAQKDQKDQKDRQKPQVAAGIGPGSVSLRVTF